MGMFQSPYDRGGVLSKEAIAERKKIYRDERSPEERKKENRLLVLFFGFPGFSDPDKSSFVPLSLLWKGLLHGHKGIETSPLFYPR